VSALYVPLVLVALVVETHRLYLALDDSVVGSLLHDSSVGGVLWTSRSPVVAGIGRVCATVALTSIRGCCEKPDGCCVIIKM